MKRRIGRYDRRVSDDAWRCARPAVGDLSVVLQHVHPGVPVAEIDDPILRHICIAGLCRQSDIRPRIDQLLRRRWNPIGDLLRLERVPDIEHTQAGIVVSREDRRLGLE